MFRAEDRIGPYQRIRPLGRGAFGEVWLAHRPTSIVAAQVALKLPLDQQTDVDVIRPTLM